MLKYIYRGSSIRRGLNTPAGTLISDIDFKTTLVQEKILFPTYFKHYQTYRLQIHSSELRRILQQITILISPQIDNIATEYRLISSRSTGGMRAVVWDFAVGKNRQNKVEC